MALCSLYLNVHDKEVNLRHLLVSLFQLSSKMLQIVTVQNVNLGTRMGLVDLKAEFDS